VKYDFNDEGHHTTVRLNVFKGHRFLQKIKYYRGKSYDGLPDVIKGHKVVDWINVYSSFEAFQDIYSPVVDFTKRGRRRKKLTLLQKIRRWFRRTF
jgi:hypothetical protein